MLAKRTFDVLVTLAAAPTWIPALLLTAAAIALSEGLPVFYVSRRVVSPGRTAPIIKFRTMVRNADKVYNRATVPVTEGVRFLNVPPDSELYTRVGRTIERLAFTEIPQLLLVLKGDMSLVGSRPLPEAVMASLREAHADVDGRLLTPAGMTGPAQLVGRERMSDRQRLDIEKAYCRIASTANTWKLDFLILLFTVLHALRLKHPMKVDEVRAFMVRHGGLGNAFADEPDGMGCAEPESPGNRTSD